MVNALSSPLLPFTSADSSGLAMAGRTAEVAQEFESLFISLMMKEMRQSGGEQGLFPGDNSDTFGGIFDMYLGQYIAKNGGIGIANTFEDAIGELTARVQS
ncbi:MAG: rod-binding protein [Planctomycetaceae bacterium]|nr:rod-binding protein [Planctomycetaceae bacterium]